MKTSEIIPFPSEWLRFQLQIVDDLLNPDAQNLRIREGADGGVFVEGTCLQAAYLNARCMHALLPPHCGACEPARVQSVELLYVKCTHCSAVARTASPCDCAHRRLNHRE